MIFSPEFGKKATITGREGDILVLKEFTFLDEEYCKVVVSLESDWFWASILFESSSERFHDFIDVLEHVLDNGYGHANFINDEGNFDLDVELNASGQVCLQGAICKDMSDDVQLKYGYVSDRIALEGFWRELRSNFPLPHH
jgi:hypothetical protein